jgi:division protein CdvB (Snf7/Vps24/ESCRT-III family)
MLYIKKNCVQALTLMVTDMDLEEKKVILSLKEAAKKGNVPVCRILAKELARSRKTKERMYASKAQMSSVMMQIQEQLGVLLPVGVVVRYRI